VPKDTILLDSKDSDSSSDEGDEKETCKMSKKRAELQTLLPDRDNESDERGERSSPRKPIKQSKLKRKKRPKRPLSARPSFDSTTNPDKESEVEQQNHQNIDMVTERETEKHKEKDQEKKLPDEDKEQDKEKVLNDSPKKSTHNKAQDNNDKDEKEETLLAPRENEREKTLTSTHVSSVNTPKEEAMVPPLSLTAHTSTSQQSGKQQLSSPALFYSKNTYLLHGDHHKAIYLSNPPVITTHQVPTSGPELRPRARYLMTPEHQKAMRSASTTSFQTGEKSQRGMKLARRATTKESRPNLAVSEVSKRKRGRKKLSFGGFNTKWSAGEQKKEENRRKHSKN